MPIQPTDEMRCPTCGAHQAWSDTCRRCKCDLRLLRAAASAYERHRLDCLRHLCAGDAEWALQDARVCHRLRPDAESHRLMALCHLVEERWREALEEAEAVALEALEPGY